MEIIEMSLSKNPIQNPQVVLREEFDNWAILFNPGTADAVGINPMGVAVWKLIDGKRIVEDIAAKIREEYLEVPENAAEEIADYIDQLYKKEFVGYELNG
jgi:SynChlorMet cassette protein ScmD